MLRQEEVRVKLSVLFLTEHRVMKVYWGWRYSSMDSLSWH